MAPIKNKQQAMDDIEDDEIRIIGTNIKFSADTFDDVMQKYSSSGQSLATEEQLCDINEEKDSSTNLPKKKTRKSFIFFLVIIIVIGISFAMWSILKHFADGNADVTNGKEQISEEMYNNYIQYAAPDTSFTEEIENKYYYKNQPTLDISDTIVNDIPLKIFWPRGTSAQLKLGRPTEFEAYDIMLAARASDVRGDIDQPTGAFVINGEIVSKGTAKSGFCAIIDGEITIGKGSETPMLEKAINTGGDFFRHFSLVNNGEPMHVSVRGKSKRRALCIINNEASIIQSESKESYHDFSQALADMGCQQAIALVGGNAMLYYYDLYEDELVETGSRKDSIPKRTENYIMWLRN